MLAELRKAWYAADSGPGSGQALLWVAPSMIAGSEWKMSEAREIFFAPKVKDSALAGAPGLRSRAMVSFAVGPIFVSRRVWSAPGFVFHPEAEAQDVQPL